VKNFLIDVLKYLPGKIVSAVIGFISIPVITRLFPPEVYGNYALALSIVNFLAITVGWVGMANMRFYPVYQREGRLLQYSSLVFKIAVYSIFSAAFIFAISLIFVKSSIDRDLYRLLWFAIPFFMLFTFFLVSQNFLRVNNQIGWFSISGIWRLVTSFLFGITLVIGLNLGVEGLFVGSILSIGLAILFIFKRSFGKVDLIIKLDLSILKKLFLYSYPLIISSAFALVIKFSDRFFLLHFRDSFEVGLYSANYAIGDHSIMLITTLFLYAAHPMGIKIWEQKGLEGAKKFLTDTTSLYIIISLPAVIGISLLYRDITFVLLDEMYWEGATILPIIAMAKFFFGIQQRYQSGIHFFKKTIYVTYSIVLAGILNVFLNILLVPQLGYVGSAFSALISYFLMAVYMIFYSRKLIKWDFPYHVALKCSLAGLIMALFLVYVPLYLLSENIIIELSIKIFTGIIIYLFFLKIFRIINFKSIFREK
jgi:O-antigen/teichoic acid export membrane protein